MNPTNKSRKLDNLGRLVIPASLRKDYGIQEGKDYQFYIHAENGKNYLCIEIGDVENTDLMKAKKLHEEAGYSVK